jgi:hypothetical protein
MHFRDTPLDIFRDARKNRDRILKRTALCRMTPYEAQSVIAMNRVMISMGRVIQEELKAAMNPEFLEQAVDDGQQMQEEA